MELSRDDTGSIVIAGLDEVLLDMIRQAPDQADPAGDLPASQRLYPAPAAASETVFLEDWRELVQPELKNLFEDANMTVRRDLDEAVETEDRGLVLRIPAAHIDAWLSSLNQARLVMFARFGFEQKDMDAEPAILPATSRDFALFQIHFYGFLQECFLRLTQGD